MCSMFALLSLHLFMYGCNLFMWKSSNQLQLHIWVPTHHCSQIPGRLPHLRVPYDCSGCGHGDTPCNALQWFLSGDKSMPFQEFSSWLVITACFITFLFSALVMSFLKWNYKTRPTREPRNEPCPKTHKYFRDKRPETQSHFPNKQWIHGPGFKIENGRLVLPKH